MFRKYASDRTSRRGVTSSLKMPHTVSRTYRLAFSHESARSEEYAKEEDRRHGSRTRWTRHGREVSSLNWAPPFVEETYFAHGLLAEDRRSREKPTAAAAAAAAIAAAAMSRHREKSNKEETQRDIQGVMFSHQTGYPSKMPKTRINKLG
ncbi:hypothetical protein HZH68_001350 [Vespula germanica]|uniref:Uncharacterized protein n=1 Tax=Vespula germanica TaxID=30212 RepID=A0A834U6V8_VESGE|nr:hypothetical protein HZH68_001350 [Vespula germanica]